MQCFYEVRMNLLAPVTTDCDFAGDVILRDLKLVFSPRIASLEDNRTIYNKNIKAEISDSSQQPIVFSMFDVKNHKHYIFKVLHFYS